MVRGIVLAESLRVGAPIAVAGLRTTLIARRDRRGSSAPAQPSIWTFIRFEAEDDVADELADQLAEALLAEGGWYADFTVGDDHVVVFAHRVFRFRRWDQEARTEAETYGRSVGVPAGQLDWAD